MPPSGRKDQAGNRYEEAAVLGWAGAFLSTPGPYATLAGAVLIVLTVHRPLARRLNWPVWACVGALLGATVIVALTLPPAPGAVLTGPQPAALGTCARRLFDPGIMWWALTHDVSRGERVGNILMFMPLVFFATLAARRKALVVLGGMLLPAVVEMSQAVLGGGRDCVGFDWMHNAIGALLGGTGAALVLVAHRRVAGSLAKSTDQLPTSLR